MSPTKKGIFQKSFFVCLFNVTSGLKRIPLDFLQSYVLVITQPQEEFFHHFKNTSCLLLEIKSKLPVKFKMKKATSDFEMGCFSCLDFYCYHYPAAQEGKCFFVMFI